MQHFEVTTPSGERYIVNAPDGATQDDAVRFVQGQLLSKEGAPSQASPSIAKSSSHFEQGKLEVAGFLFAMAVLVLVIGKGIAWAIRGFVKD